LDSSVLNEALDVVDLLIDSTRASQIQIYAAVRAINRNLDPLQICQKEMVDEARERTFQLLDLSYSDALIQNGNLSEQVATRLANLVADSLALQRRTSPNYRRDFLRELRVLTDRFSQSKRFRAALGFEYLYLPRVSYAAAPPLDLTPFQLNQFGGGGIAQARMNFDHHVTPAISLGAKVDNIEVNVAIPRNTQAVTVTSAAQRVAVAANQDSPDMLIRTTIESKLKAEFDAGATFWLLGAWDTRERNRHLKRLRDKASGPKGKPMSELLHEDPPPESTRRWDIGGGLGFTAFRIDERADTDVRLRSDPTKTFNELASSGTIHSEKSQFYRAPYMRADFRLNVSDELTLGVVARKYFGRANAEETSAQVRGATFSVLLVWYPTLGW
jgi:hypothetical protein